MQNDNFKTFMIPFIFRTTILLNNTTTIVKIQKKKHYPADEVDPPLVGRFGNVLLSLPLPPFPPFLPFFAF